jgi:murein peptide amidase A
MRVALSLIIAVIGLSSCVSRDNTAPMTIAKEVVTETITSTTIPPKSFPQLSQYCVDSLKGFAGKSDPKALKEACDTVQVLPGCESAAGKAIYHYDRPGDAKDPANILVFSLIHGDETPAGSVGRFWLERLQSISPRNNWRVIPILNPDGLAKKTRTNGNKVNVNRNFPTEDWNEKAQLYWKKEGKSSARRFPGKTAASEPETQCAMKHIEDFKPDFVVSIHTPLKVLDYDGPKVNPPKFADLPWKSLGHYPGSLGRYMWFERKVPVLTMELKEDLPNSNDPWVKLQDIIGTLVGLEQMNKPTKK